MAVSVYIVYVILKGCYMSCNRCGLTIASYARALVIAAAAVYVLYWLVKYFK